MGETVQALARKADVKARAHEKVAEAKKKGHDKAEVAMHKVAEVGQPAVRAASRKRWSIPLGAALAAAGGLLLAARGRGRHGHARP